MSFILKLLRARLQRTPTRQQWFSNLENLERLREILVDPVFVAATNHIIDERRINEVDVFANAAILPLRAAYSAGHTSFIRDLEALAKVPATQMTLPEEWSHISAD